MTGATPTDTPTSIPIRFVTAASLFDGHDAAINVMRRILQSMGCEVFLAEYRGYGSSTGRPSLSQMLVGQQQQ